MKDKQLVDAFLKNRSEKAFSALYQSKTPRLYKMALRLTAHNSYQAEELVQEMWLLAIRKLDSFEWRSELNTWLTGILINLAKRRKSERPTVEIREEPWEEQMEEEKIQFTPDDLENAINELSLGYRQVVILHDIEGYKHKEIAAILNCSEGTSKSQLHHARKALRHYLIEGKDKNTRL